MTDTRGAPEWDRSRARNSEVWIVTSVLNLTLSGQTFFILRDTQRIVNLENMAQWTLPWNRVDFFSARYYCKVNAAVLRIRRYVYTYRTSFWKSFIVGRGELSRNEMGCKCSVRFIPESWPGLWRENRRVHRMTKLPQTCRIRGEMKPQNNNNKTNSFKRFKPRAEREKSGSLQSRSRRKWVKVKGRRILNVQQRPTAKPANVPM